MGPTVLETKEVLLIGFYPAHIIVGMWNKMDSEVFMLIFSLILNQCIWVFSLWVISSLSFKV
jgi:hypothetical protein